MIKKLRDEFEELKRTPFTMKASKAEGLIEKLINCLEELEKEEEYLSSLCSEFEDKLGRTLELISMQSERIKNLEEITYGK